MIERQRRERERERLVVDYYLEDLEAVELRHI
jgi:hypothetical protein